MYIYKQFPLIYESIDFTGYPVVEHFQWYCVTKFSLFLFSRCFNVLIEWNLALLVDGSNLSVMTVRIHNNRINIQITFSFGAVRMIKCKSHSFWPIFVTVCYTTH